MIRFSKLSLAWFAVACLVGLIGCSGSSSGPNTVPAKGTLTIDGQRANDVMITLSPEDPKNPPASGRVTNGEFELHTGTEGKAGAVPGKYKVTLSAAPSAESAAAAYKSGAKGPPKIQASFPPEYNSPTTSKKEVEITRGSNNLKIEITK